MRRYCGMRMTPETLAWLGMISAHEYIELTNVQLEKEFSAESRKRISDSHKERHEKRRAQIVGAEP
jgi:hypothetical protein